MQPATFPVSGELRMTAKCASMERYQPKDQSWISRYRAGVVKHICKFPFVRFSIEVD